MNMSEALGTAEGRYDAVAAAYDGMDVPDRIVFRKAIKNDEYTHAQVAKALRAMGYDVDRKQVFHYREKLALGKVNLDSE